MSIQRGILRSGLRHQSIQRRILRWRLSNRSIQRGILRSGLSNRSIQRGILQHLIQNDDELLFFIILILFTLSQIMICNHNRKIFLTIPNNSLLLHSEKHIKL
jgi:hypothetical protein